MHSASKDILRTALPLIGAAVFFVLSSPVDVIVALAVGACLPVYVRCEPVLASHFVLKFATFVVRLIFCGLLLLLCVFFHNKVFIRNAWSRYGLAFVILGTLSTWFGSLLWQSNDALAGGQSAHSVCDQCGANISQGDPDCLYLNTTLYQAGWMVGPYLTPILVQFLLLALQMLVGMLLAMENPRQDESGSYGDHNTQSVLTSLYRKYAQFLKDNLDTGEEPHLNHGFHDNFGVSGSGRFELRLTAAEHVQPTSGYQTTRKIPVSVVHQLRQRAIGIQEVLRELLENEEESSTRRRNPHQNLGDINRDAESLQSQNSDARAHIDVTDDVIAGSGPRSAFSFPTVLLPLVYNLLYIVLTAVAFNGGGNQEVWKTVYLIFRLGYKTAMNVACICGFAFSGSLKPKFRKFTGLELMLILTTSGYSLKLCLKTMAVFHKYLAPDVQDPDKDDALDLVNAVLNIVSVCLQTVFLCHAGRVTRPDPDRGVSTRFRAVLLYLALSNFVTWINDSFIVYQNYDSLTPHQGHFFGKGVWPKMYYVLFPLGLFFRFNSACLFLQIFLGY